jgi:acylphosphatase
MERVSIQVFGRVQGVGFRNLTQRRARRLGLTGWVRNELDGSVQLVAEGPRAELDILERWVRAGGPPDGRVDRCELTRGEATGEYATFVVLR